jgi:AraC-like DNA-binding protein
MFGGMSAPEEVRAWKPAVPGVAEAFHARFVDHVYPMHTHDTWTLLILDSGGIKYDLDLHEHGSLGGAVTLLPPHVPHSGSSIRPEGFRKRVLYLDESCLSGELIGRSVGRPVFADPLLRDRINRLHEALAVPGGEFEAESRLSLIARRLAEHLTGTPGPLPRARDPRLACELRELLDARLPEGVSLEQASQILHADPAYLVRVFTRHFGLSPHQYLTGRRVDLARRLLLAGMPGSEVAQAAGFYDQSHLTRHFRRFLGTTPGRFASGPPAAA